MFNQDATLRKAVNIAGDPFSPESKWMAACIAAGNSELVAHHEQQSPLKKVAVAAGKSFGIVAITANSVMSLACCMFIAVHFCWLITGADTNWFMEQTRLAQMTGLAVLLLGTFGFWNNFSFHKTNSLRDGFWTLSGLALVGLALFGGVGPTMAVLSGIAAYAAMGWTARTLRELVPASFRADKAVICKGVASIPWAAFVIWALYSSFTSPAESGPYSAPDLLQLVFMQVFLGVAVAAPAATVARISKSSSTKACLALNTVLHAPVLLALTTVTLMSTGVWLGSILAPGTTGAALSFLGLPALSSLMATQGGPVVLALLGATASYMGHTAVGSWIGAASNKGRDRLALEKRSTPTTAMLADG